MGVAQAPFDPYKIPLDSMADSVAFIISSAILRPRPL